MRDVTNPLPQPSATYKRLNGYGRRNDETSSTSSRISDNSIIYKGHSFNLTKQPLCDLLKEGVRRTPGASTSSTVANDQVNGNGTDFSFVHPKDCAIIVERPARRASSMKAGPSPKVNGFRENKNRTSNLSHLDFSGAPRRLTRHSQPSISLPDISNGQQLPEEEIDIMNTSIAENVRQRGVARARKKKAQIEKIQSKAKKPKLDGSNPEYKCECLTITKITTASEAKKKWEGKNCTAIDSVHDKPVSCTRPAQSLLVDDANCQMRADWLCTEHNNRRQRHLICPSCNQFCCAGSFSRCWATVGTRREVHYFHPKCYSEDLCPHCGSTQIVNVNLRYPSCSKSEQDSAEEGPTKVNDLPQMLKLTKHEINKICVLLKTPISPIRFTEKKFLAALVQGKLEESIMYIKESSPNYKFKDGSNTPLHIAAMHNNLKLVILLIELKAQVNLQNEWRRTPLVEAIRHNSWCTANFLSWQPNNGIELLSRKRRSVLHLAGKKVAPAFVWQELLKWCHHINLHDANGFTPLAWAVEKCETEAVRCMLAHGASLHTLDWESNTALHWAAFTGNAENVKLLVESGADLNAINKYGETPLHLAAKKCYASCVITLLAYRPEMFVLNIRHETPKQVASHNKNQVYRLLQLREESTKKIRIHHKAEYKTERILNSDISNGKETMPISVVNGEDEEEAPTDFVYLIANCETVSQNINRTISSLQGCSCEKDGGCLSSKSCKCATLSKGSWYNRNTGRLLDSFNTTNKSNLIYECNQTCKCDVTLCPNRTVQRGIQVPLQIFRTKKKGWGVRTLGPVDKGTFICEYIGEIISDKEADHIKNDSYLFDLESKGGEVFCLDARDYGNVSRFINHHCQPNLISVKVLVEHQDTTAPRIALFAARDIAINEELGFDYGAKFWQIKLKYFTCECGDVFCRYGTTPK